MTQTITIREGTANVFVAVEHSNSELIGIHASRSANRFEALELVRSGGASVCTVCGHRGADVLPLFEPVRMGTDA